MATADEPHSPSALLEVQPPSEQTITSHSDLSSDSITPVPANLEHQLDEAIRNDQYDELERLLGPGDDLLETLLHYELDEQPFEDEGERIEILSVTPLALAAALGKTSIVQLLLKRDANVNSADPKFGETALHLASRHGRKEVVDLLLSRNADIHKKGREGCTPLHLAARYGRTDVVTSLLDAKADLNQGDDDDGDTPFFIACIYDQLETLQLLWERGPKDQINHKNARSNGPLHTACLNGCLATAEWLLDLGVAIDQLGVHRRSPLLLACEVGDTEIIDMLLSRGADPHKAQDDDRNSPILWSCYNVQPQSLDTLLRHDASVTSVDKDGDNCFHKAISGPAEFSDALEHVLDSLISAGGDINKLNNIGCSPLYLACELGKFEHVKALINNGAKVIAHDKEGHTPLHAAIANENIDIALEILATPDYFPTYPATEKAFTERTINLADVVEIEDILLEEFEEREFEEYQQLPTILHWAISNGALRLAQRCISYNPQVLQWKRNGATWLHIVAQYGQTQLLQPGIGALGVAVGHSTFPGIDVLAQAEGNITALHVAVVNDDVETTQLLLQMLPDQSQKVEAIMDRNNQGTSPLTISINRRCKDLEKLFWDEICKLGTTNKDFIDSDPAKAGRILELVAQYETPGHEAVLKELLQLWFRGENDIHEKMEYTTLDWAVDCSQVAVLWWLLSKGGYSSNAVERALKLVPDDYLPSDVRHYIKKLLLKPPPILDTVANPNTGRITLVPAPVDQNNPSLQMEGNIVDIYANFETVNVPYTRASIRDIIYDKGPDSLMTTAKEDLSQRDLNVLKMTLKENIPNQSRNDSGPSPGEYELPDSRSTHSAGSESQHDTTAGNERSDGMTSNLRLRWIHLPVNELQLMRDLVCRLSHDSNRLELDHSVLMKHFNRSWIELAAGGKQSYMKPQCVRMQIHPTASLNNVPANSHLSGEGTACTALYMPYLILGRYKKPKTECGVPEPDGPMLEESMYSRNLRKVLHTPMTLDQYYYPTIDNTDERDNDQVVSKYLHQENDTEKSILMVNNLWIWIVDQKTIITATAEGSDEKYKSNLLQATLDNILYGGSRSRFERATTVESVMELILGVAVGSFMEKSIPVGDLKKGPIEIFRESIRNVTNEENQLFKKFLAGLNDEAKGSGILQDKKYWLNSLGGQNRYHIISDETDLLYRTRDIYDELQMLMSLAGDQGIVWMQAFSSNGSEGQFQHYHSCTPADVKKDLDEILSGTKQTTNYINTLLDLRQAEYSRIQAHGSAKLSNSILVFTIVTIVFLPLSFLSSLFALDVSVFPHESGELKYEGWWLFPILFGVTAIFSGPAIALAWNVDVISSWFLLHTKGRSEMKDPTTSDVASDFRAQQSIGRGFRRRIDLGRWESDRNDLP